MNSFFSDIHKEIATVIKGKNTTITKVLCAILAGGHILLDDIPGVGKTTLAMSISRTMSLNYARIQFTPDVLPSDITGFSMFNSQTKEFEFQKGAVFCNLFLADEINRTSARTQSALLEVMEEGRVTVDGTTYPIANPFIVIATQNPVGSVGTQRLPDSQLDRFMICLSIGYPDHTSAIEILKGNTGEQIAKMQSIVTKEELIAMQKQVKKVFVHDSVFDYIVNLTEATRDPSLFNLGLSPRGSIALLNMAKASAFIHQQDFLAPEDIGDVFLDVAAHRVIVNPNAKINKKDALCHILETTPLPRVHL